MIPDEFDIFEAIAKSYNDAHPNGVHVTATEVRQELGVLLSLYGQFKRVQNDSSEVAQIHLCSFCGRSRAQVEGLLVGHDGACICNECVALCQEYFRRSN